MVFKPGTLVSWTPGAATIQYPWSSRNGKGHTKSGCPGTGSTAGVEPASSSIEI